MHACDVQAIQPLRFMFYIYLLAPIKCTTTHALLIERMPYMRMKTPIIMSTIFLISLIYLLHVHHLGTPTSSILEEAKLRQGNVAGLSIYGNILFITFLFFFLLCWKAKLRPISRSLSSNEAIDIDHHFCGFTKLRWYRKINASLFLLIAVPILINIQVSICLLMFLFFSSQHKYI